MEPCNLTLYDYYRSTASYRVRIALYLKNLPYESQEVHLVNNGGEQHSPEYKAIHPQELVPALRIGDDKLLTQSLAIIEYLDELYPNPPLFPQDPFDKALVRSLALTICCDIHPLNNLRVLQQLKKEFKADETAVQTWYHHWLRLGFDAIEKQLEKLPRSKPFCFGDRLSLADLCLIPQVYNAKRFEFSLDLYPLISEINDHCMDMEAFCKVAPSLS